MTGGQVFPIYGGTQGVILRYVVKYLRFHLFNPGNRLWIAKPIKTNKITEVTGGVEKKEPANQTLCEFDVNFVNELWDLTILNGKDADVPERALWALIKTANWCQIRQLVQLCCCKPACEIKGKREEEVIQILGLDPNSDDVKAVLADKQNTEQTDAAAEQNTDQLEEATTGQTEELQIETPDKQSKPLGKTEEANEQTTEQTEEVTEQNTEQTEDAGCCSIMQVCKDNLSVQVNTRGVQHVTGY